MLLRPAGQAVAVPNVLKSRSADATARCRSAALGRAYSRMVSSGNCCLTWSGC